MPKAEEALKSAPGVLAVKVDFKTQRATIGTEMGESVPITEILAALEKIGYHGKLVDQPAEK